LSRSARGDSVQTIWFVGRHSDPFTLDITVLRCVTVALLGMSLLAYLSDTYLLIFEGHASWSQSLGICFMVGLRYYWVWVSPRVQSHLISLYDYVIKTVSLPIIGYVISGKSATFFLLSSPSVWKNALLVLDCTHYFAPVTCFSQQGQYVRMNSFFCVNALA